MYLWYVAGVLGWNSWGLWLINTHVNYSFFFWISHYGVCWDRGTSNYSLIDGFFWYALRIIGPSKAWRHFDDPTTPLLHTGGKKTMAIKNYIPGNSAFSWPFWDGEWKRDPNSRVVGDQPNVWGPGSKGHGLNHLDFFGYPIRIWLSQVG